MDDVCYMKAVDKGDEEVICGRREVGKGETRRGEKSG